VRLRRVQNTCRIRAAERWPGGFHNIEQAAQFAMAHKARSEEDFYVWTQEDFDY